MQCVFQNLIRSSGYEIIVEINRSSDFAAVKKRNRHSGDFYQWNHYQQQYHPATAANNIVIPVNRFSMFENRLIIDPDPRMETLDRRIPGKDAIWKSYACH